MPGRFPLAIHASQRYLVDASGAPFFIHGDTPWSLVVQCTREQIDTYLRDRKVRGFNTIMFNAIEHQYSSQTPKYRNAYGDDPFTSMTDFASPNDAYWRVVDYAVNSALRLGIACIINPAYWGYNGGSEGWWTEINAETNADLQTYGAFLANRFKQPNVLWCFGGDWSGGSSTNRDKQWNIVTGIRSVRTTDIITCHNIRTDSDAYSNWNGYAGFNLNNAYIASDGSDGYSESATAYGRSMPFFMIECGYENENANYYLGAMQAVFSGACGHLFGNNPLWSFDYTGASYGGAAGTVVNGLNTTGQIRMGYFGALMASVPFHKLEPKTDTTLVTSTLSTGITRVCPMLSKDKDFAMVWVNDARTITINLAAFTGRATLRARWWDWTTGTFTLIGTYPNSGTQNFTSTGARVLVID